ncbi:ATP-binding protein [Sphingomonas arantia]|uniref:histidine kinase n=1 Tax=Sphingomonas arantia TaxID=1460676 RepID=A0ABW4TWQ1_9SPHN
MAERRITTPLYLRMFTIVLACVGAVQLLNVAFVVLIGPPLPRIYTVEQVAEALRRGGDPAGQIVVTPAATARNEDNARTVTLRKAIARQLTVPIERVRIAGVPSPRPDGPLFGARRMRRPDVRQEILLGGFSVSVRRGDGSWLSAQPVRTGFERWRIGALALIVASLLAAIGFAWLLTRWVARPITLFAEAAERLGQDPRGAPVPLEGPPEIAHAAKAFNEMQRRLKGYVEDRTIMIGAVAHDLRTPLMRLALQMERLPAQYRPACERAIAEMDAMISAATDYVRDVSEPSARRRLDLRSLAEAVVDDFVDGGGDVTIVPGPKLVVEGDPISLRAVLNNLIGNALRYAQDATVELAEVEGATEIRVRDHGPGIPAEDLERVFEPFFRGERSRNRETGGVGLGLASVRGIVRAHGGEVTVLNHPDGGVIATVMLPARRDRPA